MASKSRAWIAWCIFVSSVSVATGAYAQTARFLHSEQIDVAQDKSTVTLRHLETTPLTPGAVQTYSQYRFSFTANQTLEILEAYTRKANGEIVQVDQSQIATQDGALGRVMSFTDVKYKQVPFSNLAVGDTWVLKLKIVEKEQYIPGHFSKQYSVLPNAADYKYSIVVRSPEQVLLQYYQREFELEEKRIDGQIERRWTGNFSAKPRTEEDVADQTSVYPILQISTFANWGELAKISHRDAAPKFAVTPTIKRLADDITAGRTDARSQAEAIYAWVSKNMQYVAVFFGTGRFVPNDVDTIVARRFGDCKDHVALMTALLAAKGIDSDWVLIGTQNSYQLPSVPMIQAFNHVILYIPSLDLYADVTSPFTPFGDLPRADRDKPVLRASAKAVNLARTSPGTSSENVSQIETRITFAGDGTFKGETVTESRGEEAISLRAFIDRAEVQGANKVFEGYMKTNGVTDVALNAPSSRDHTAPYVIKTNWSGTRTNAIEKGWRPFYGITPIGTFASHFFGGVDKGKRSQPVECRPGRVTHTLKVVLPQGFSLSKAPTPISQKTQHYEYTRTWAKDTNTITITTQLVSTTGRRVCGADVINAINAEIDKDRERLNPVLTFAKVEG